MDSESFEIQMSRLLMQISSFELKKKTSCLARICARCCDFAVPLVFLWQTEEGEMDERSGRRYNQTGE